MNTNELSRPGRHPGKMPDGIKLFDCVRELEAIFQRMTLTERDRATTEYRGWSAIAPPASEFVDPVEYAQGVYLSDAARRSIRASLMSGFLPAWTDWNGSFVEIDPSRLFVPNRFNAKQTVNTGVYFAMNTSFDRDGELREQQDGATLWVHRDAWPPVRDSLIAERERQFGSELAPEWRQLLTSAAENAVSATAEEPELAAAVEQWSLYEAVAWIASHDLSLVEEQSVNVAKHLKEGRDPGVITWTQLEQRIKNEHSRCDQPSLDCDCIDQARENLRVACELGRVRATGIGQDRGSRRMIPAADFISAELWPGRGSSLHRMVAGKGEPARWLDLRFGRDDVRALGGSMSPTASAIAPPSTNHEIGQLVRPPIKASELRDWIRNRNLEGWSQDQIAKAAADAFPNQEVPGRPQIRKVDDEVRTELKLPPRKRGRRKKADSPQFASDYFGE